MDNKNGEDNNKSKIRKMENNQLNKVEVIH